MVPVACWYHLTEPSGATVSTGSFKALPGAACLGIFLEGESPKCHFSLSSLNVRENEVFLPTFDGAGERNFTLECAYPISQLHWSIAQQYALPDVGLM